ASSPLPGAGPGGPASSGVLKKPVQGPDVAGAQTLETNADAGLVARALLDDPAHVARHLDGLGLGGQREAQLHGRADRQWRRRGQVQTAQRDVLRLRKLLLSFERDLDFELPFVARVDSPEMLGQNVFLRRSRC